MPEAKIPPHSEETEVCVLGSALIDKDAIITVADFLRPEHFYKNAHRLIYQALLELYEERSPIDIVTLKEKLKQQKVLTKVGGGTYLTHLVNSVPTAAHVERYGRIVKDNYTKRELIAAAGKFAEAAFDEGQEAADVLDKAEQAIFSLSQKHLKQVFAPVKDILAESFDRLDELHKKAGGLRGVPTGFKDLDNALAGMQDSNLLILASRPGLGKTSLALGIAHYAVVKEKLPVGFFSLEMSKEELVDRLLVSQADIDAWKLKTGRLDEKDFTRLSEAMGVLAEAPLFIDDTPALSVLEMRTKARRLVAEHGLRLLVVDYLQLARGSRRYENRVQEVAEISMGLKNLARELKIPILACSQLSRAVEQRGRKRPVLADLRESGCLTGDTQIMRADTGKLISLKELAKSKKSIPVLAMTVDLKLKTHSMIKIFSSGIKEIFSIKFRSGRQIKASANHPFYSVLGWKRVDQLKVGDRLAVARKIIPLSKNSVTKVNIEEIILLAHFLGDGCYLKHQPLHYTNASPANLKAVQKSAQSAFGLKAKKVKQKNWYHLYFSGDPKKGIKNPISEWFKKLGIYNQKSPEKQIPDFVFNLSLQKLSVFIKHLWATDGCFVPATSGGFALYYASTSRELVTQLQHLLLRFNIISRIKKTKKEGYRGGFALQISGKDEQLKFLKNIGIHGKEKKILEAIKKLSKIKANPNLDVIPKEVWCLIEEERKKRGLSTREFHKKLNWAYSGTQRHKNGVSRKRLSWITTVLKERALINLASSDLYWDEVEFITKEGREEVFDATVSKAHNFLANDIVVHNSIEQDADVVMFLWREDEENMENVDLEIAKHRNGPLRRFRLRFRGDRIRFYGLETKRGEG